MEPQPRPVHAQESMNQPNIIGNSAGRQFQIGGLPRTGGAASHDVSFYAGDPQNPWRH